MHMIYQTRYSFFNPSPGWRSKASKDMEILFDTERLKRRQYFFEKVTLRSLADQTNKSFVHNILSSTFLPKTFQKQLKAMCGDMLGDRAHVMFCDPDPTHVHFRTYRWQHFTADPWSCQVVLDDDDALSVDFNEKLHAEAAAAKNLRARGEKYSCISHACGLTGLFKNGKLSLHPRVSATTNLGLAIVAPSPSRYSLYDISHKNIMRDRPTRVLYSQRPYYIRAVHDDNDSRGLYDKPLVPDDQIPEMFEYFPLLHDLSKDWVTDFSPQAKAS
ncbi:glycosyltransferase [uncultured Tateyamaria sp.]|uniref:glycosyltransferase n=1 Tax=uncultured Tateyamaria sp. TaxID=455651 RepID=UPI00261CE3C7|nr:glycosyltransferase [uncultured Tateyamaria sp.]